MQHRFGEPGRQLEVLGLSSQGFAGELDDLLIIGYLAITLPVALRSVVILPACILDLVVDGSVSKVGAPGVIPWDWVEEIVAQGHASRYDFGDGRKFDFADFENRYLVPVDVKNPLAEGHRL